MRSFSEFQAPTEAWGVGLALVAGLARLSVTPIGYSRQTHDVRARFHVSLGKNRQT